jgi:tRNA(fMet)-specific endonuclease VapC
VKYLMDTNTCIRFLNGRSPQIVAKLPVVPIQDVVVCSVVKAEMFAGAAKSDLAEVTRQKQERFLRPYRSLPFDDIAANAYAILRAQLEVAGKPIGPNDMLIAAIAIANDLILVTHNTQEFNRVKGLRLEDWEVQ